MNGVTLKNPENELDSQLLEKHDVTVVGLQTVNAVKFVEYVNEEIEKLEKLINDPQEAKDFSIRSGSIKYGSVYLCDKITLDDVHIDSDLKWAKQRVDREVERIKEQYLEKIRECEETLEAYQ